MPAVPKYRARIVFVGCVEEGKTCLREILNAGGNVVAILTFTDDLFEKTSGAVRFDDLAKKYDIPIFKVRTTNSPESVALIKELQPDAIFVIGWTRLVSEEVLKIPKHGCFGMHASLLPKLRGRAPVNWAIIKNEKVTGNTLMHLDAGVDTGDIVAQKRFEINMADTCKTVYDKVAQAGVEMLHEFIPLLDSGTFTRKPQGDREAASLPKRTPEDGVIDWGKTSLELYNWVRALTHPYPGAFTYLRGRKLFIWAARILHQSNDWCGDGVPSAGAPGTVLSVADGIIVAVGRGELLSLHRLEFEEEPEYSWQQFVETYDLRPGERFSTPRGV